MTDMDVSVVISSARPSRSTLAAWSSRKLFCPSAICRFMPISAASRPSPSGSGAASGRI